MSHIADFGDFSKVLECWDFSEFRDFQGFSGILVPNAKRENHFCKLASGLHNPAGQSFVSQLPASFRRMSARFRPTFRRFFAKYLLRDSSRLLLQCLTQQLNNGWPELKTSLPSMCGAPSCPHCCTLCPQLAVYSVALPAVQLPIHFVMILAPQDAAQFTTSLASSLAIHVSCILKLDGRRRQRRAKRHRSRERH